MFDTAGFLPLRRSKWQVQPATAATYRKHHEAARMAAFRSLVHFIRPLQASEQACSRGRVGGGGGRLADSWYRCIGGIKQQLCQYSRLQKSSERAGIHKDFAMTGLNGSSVWFSQILWLNNSVIHILSALKSPILSFKSLPSGQGTFFFSGTVPLSLFAAFSCSSPAAFSPAFPSSLLLTSAEVWVRPSPPSVPPVPCLAQGPYSQIGLHWRDKCSANALKHVQ